MRRILRFLGWLIGAVATLAVIFWLLPRERVVMGAVPVFDDPVAFLAEREGAFDDIRPGDAARIIWAGAAGAVTPLAILYLHGFSAGPEENRAVPDDVARDEVAIKKALSLLEDEEPPALHSLARQVGLTLIGRARGKRFIALAGEDRITFDVDVSAIADEPRGMNRKGATAE